MTDVGDVIDGLSERYSDRNFERPKGSTTVRELATERDWTMAYARKMLTRAYDLGKLGRVLGWNPSHNGAPCYYYFPTARKK